MLLVQWKSLVLHWATVLMQRLQHALTFVLPVQGLKKAYEVMIGHSFEEMLQEADSADLLAEGGSPTAASKEQKQSRAVQTAEMTLLRRPVVFTLAIVWDSPQVGHISYCASLECNRICAGCMKESVSEIFS